MIGLLSNTFQKKKSVEHRKGFTLIEVIVTMALFTMTVLMAITLLVVFIQQQRRTVSQEQLQNDVRAVMERIAQDLREGRVDYGYYTTIFAADQKRLFSSLNGQNTEALVLLDAFSQRIMYRLSGGQIQRCVSTTADCAAPDVWEFISANTMQVQAFTFILSPSEDPFASQQPAVCSAPFSLVASEDPAPNNALCRWGTTCKAVNEAGIELSKVCALARGNNTQMYCYCVPQQINGLLPLQPRVTFSIQAQRTVGGKTVSDIFQTTIASRLFQNIDRLNQYAP